MGEQLKLMEKDVFPMKKPENPNWMVRALGADPQNRKCKECAFLFRLDNIAGYYKCSKRKVTHGDLTDHRMKWDACKLIEEKPKKVKPVKVKKITFRNIVKKAENDVIHTLSYHADTNFTMKADQWRYDEESMNEDYKLITIPMNVKEAIKLRNKLNSFIDENKGRKRKANANSDLNSQ